MTYNDVHDSTCSYNNTGDTCDQQQNVTYVKSHIQVADAHAAVSLTCHGAISGQTF